jgi:mRNA interferase YafQ
MKRIHYTKAFKKDYKTVLKRGLDVNKLIEVIKLLAEGKDLPQKYKVHRLQGKWHDFLECHIKPDWLLIWSQDQDNIYPTRTGTHSDLY